jgi:hypothetical protein
VGSGAVSAVSPSAPNPCAFPDALGIDERRDKGSAEREPVALRVGHPRQSLGEDFGEQQRDRHGKRRGREQPVRPNSSQPVCSACVR